MDARIGTLVKEGKTIYYAFIAGKEYQNADLSAVEFNLNLLDRQNKAEAIGAPLAAIN